MTDPKEEQAKTLYPLAQTQPFEKEKRTKFAMENQFMSLIQVKFSYCRIRFYMFSFHAVLGWEFNQENIVKLCSGKGGFFLPYVFFNQNKYFGARLEKVMPQFLFCPSGKYSISNFLRCWYPDQFLSSFITLPDAKGTCTVSIIIQSHSYWASSRQCFRLLRRNHL